MSEDLKKRVLIVEDDRGIREALSDLLASENYHVALAADGAQALEWLRLNKETLPHLIILDLMMPGMDGYQFRERQEVDPVFSRIPILLMTADGNVDIKMIKIGVKKAIRKPVEVDHLLRLVKELTEKQDG